MSDDDIIDLTEYRRERERLEDEEEEHGVFALDGAEGERSRFALPLWRIIYLASGGRGGVVYRDEGEDGLHSLVVLDLKVDPARTDFDDGLLPLFQDPGEPELVEAEDGTSVAVSLGEKDGRAWYVIVDGCAPRGPLERVEREDILFLAGECSGLIFVRDLGDAAGVDEMFAFWERYEAEAGDLEGEELGDGGVGKDGGDR